MSTLPERLRDHHKRLTEPFGTNVTELREDLMAAAKTIERAYGITVVADDPGKLGKRNASDQISESTIARIAGNLLSGVMAANNDTWMLPPEAVMEAVAAARAIAAEVERTKGS